MRFEINNCVVIDFEIENERLGELCTGSVITKFDVSQITSESGLQNLFIFMSNHFLL